VLNKGVIRAEAADPGSRLYFYGASLDNSNGLVQVADGAALFVNGGLVSGGVLQSLGTASVQGTGQFSSVLFKGRFDISGNTFTNVAFEGNHVINSSLTVNGTLTNDGQLALNGTLLNFSSDITLAGNGQTALNGGSVESSNGFVGNRLTIGAGHTLRGYGTLGGGYYGYDATRVVNNGAVIADSTSGVLSFRGSEFTNRGQLKIESAATMRFNGTHLLQDGALARTVVNGTLALSQLDLQAGQLTGVGSVDGSVVNSGGQVSPGASPGKLTVTGDYTQLPGGSLLIEINGPDQGLSFDWLAIGGSATLGGDLFLNIGYTPVNGSSFTILTADGGVSGLFNHVYAAGWDVVTTYGANDVKVSLSSSATVPEPESIVLLLAGLGVVLAIRARKLAN
jgi:fibronectin-binding autotransporter adhesin